MALPQRMKFGIFLAPFHPLGENPTLAIERDLELVQWLDTLGFDEVWSESTTARAGRRSLLPRSLSRLQRSEPATSSWGQA